jgi:hypothetical protein
MTGYVMIDKGHVWFGEPGNQSESVNVAKLKVERQVVDAHVITRQNIQYTRILFIIYIGYLITHTASAVFNYSHCQYGI